MKIVGVSAIALEMLTAVTGALGLGLSAAFAQVQAPAGPGPTGAAAPASPPSIPPATGGSASSGGSYGLMFLAVVIALVVIIALLARWSAMRSKRATEALQLESEIVDALLSERGLVNLSVMPKVHVPFWSGSPATVEMSGNVPSPEVREEVMHVAEREAARIRPDVHIHDRLTLSASRAA